MSRTSVLFFLFAAAAVAQNQNLGSGSSTYGPGIHVQYVTVAEPALNHSDLSSGSGFDGKVLHHWMLDRSAKTYFGYDLLVEPVAGTTRCKVSILPLSLTLDQINHHSHNITLDASWRPAPLPSYPAPQIVEPGDTIALDMMASADGRQKVVDYLQASCRNDVKIKTAASVPARDFTIDDIALDVSDASLYVNDAPVGGTPLIGGAQGSVVWLYFPGKGRFLVSIVPRPGFQKMGTIRGSKISFDFGGAHYEARGSHPPAPSGVWNAYVMFDAAYGLSGRNAAFGGAATVEGALAQK